MRGCQTLALVLKLIYIGSVSAAPADMRVVTDDILDHGEFGLEFQANIAQPVVNDSSGQGSVFQGIFEPTYGIAENWEASLQMPAEQINGAWYETGFNTELQYAAPHDETKGFYWGGRSEINFVNPVGMPESWQSEWRAVHGFRVDGWHLVLNPSFTVPLTGANRQITFEPSAKVVHQINKQTDVGMEYFVEAGSIAHLLPYQQQYGLPMLVADKKLGRSEINIGVGKGLTNSSDRWVFKTILSLPFDSL
jgi:hypothetical protein